jgi:hypothetical protein
MVCKLNKAIYGLKQAARCWHDKLSCILAGIGLKPFLSDSCIYANDDRSIVIAFYVDDLLIVSKNKLAAGDVVRKLEKNFQLSDKGELSNYLGLNFIRKDGRLFVSQKTYIQNMLTKYNMTDSNGVDTPIVPGTDLSPGEDDEDFENIQLYRSIVGSLIHLANYSRPDIQFATNQLCRFMSTAKKSILWLRSELLAT